MKPNAIKMPQTKCRARANAIMKLHSILVMKRLCSDEVCQEDEATEEEPEITRSMKLAEKSCVICGAELYYPDKKYCKNCKPGQKTV